MCLIDHDLLGQRPTVYRLGGKLMVIGLAATILSCYTPSGIKLGFAGINLTLLGVLLDFGHQFLWLVAGENERIIDCVPTLTGVKQRQRELCDGEPNCEEK